MNKIKKYFILQLVILIYAGSSIASKLASNESFFSFKFCLYYGILLLLLAIYAILWQQVLKKFPLSIAYVNKAATIIWSMLIGHFFFKEQASLFNILGALIVMIGIIIMIKGEEKHE